MPTQKSQDLEKSAYSRDPKAYEVRGEPKELLIDISSLCFQQNPQRFIYAHVEPLLPKEHNEFWRGKSTVDQVVLVTQNIENFFEAKKKSGVIFVNLTETYGTVWHCGLTCKLLRHLPYKQMARTIMEFVRNRCFLFTTGDIKQNKLRRTLGIGLDSPPFKHLHV